MRHEQGMTLIEVLIALAILGIALTAVLHAATVSLRQSYYLQQKTLATWAGLEILEQIEAGLREAPSDGSTLQGESMQGGISWTWEASRKASPQKGISRLDVSVAPAAGETASLVTLTGYLYQPSMTGSGENAR